MWSPPWDIVKFWSKNPGYFWILNVYHVFEKETSPSSLRWSLYTSYWTSVKLIILVKFYICAFINQDEVLVHKYEKNSWPIPSHLNQTSLVYYIEKDHYLLPAFFFWNPWWPPRGTTACVMFASKLRTAGLFHFASFYLGSCRHWTIASFYIQFWSFATFGS